MKKMNLTKLMAVLVVLCLITSTFVGSTLAKYVTNAHGTDKARVAVWGINADAVTMDLFDGEYANDVESNDGDNVIAPGTSKFSNFSIVTLDATLAPETDYEIKIDLTGSKIANEIKNNPNIVWKLDDGAAGTWDDLMTAILRLTGDSAVVYEAGVTESAAFTYEATEIAAEFANGKTHKITWEWKFENDADASGDFTDEDEYDTAMGNAAVSGDIEVELVVDVTATQLDR